MKLFKRTPSALSAGEIYTVKPTDFRASTADVADTTGVFDDEEIVHTLPVPGFPGEDYVPWGVDDQLPYELIHLVGGDEVTSQNKLFNVLTCYGAGLRFAPIKDDVPQSSDSPAHPSTPPALFPSNQQGTDAAEALRAARAWAIRQNLPTYFLEQTTDMKYFFFSVAVIILSKDGTQINRIRHKEACYCRLGKADKNGHIPYVYYANWRRHQAYVGTIEKITLLDERDPLTDLMQRMGREPLADGKVHKPQSVRKFAMLMRFPTAGCQYYPVPYWSAVLRGGSYDEKRLISVGKRAKLRNHTSVKYQVEIEQNYWAKICKEEYITDREEQAKRIRKEKENIRDFIAGLENSDKVWISSFYIDLNGHEHHDVKITKIDTGKEGGDWSEDVQAASNTICYADNVHPNLVGAVPGKSQSNNSGSDKRELFTMKQALEIAFHDILLLPLRLVCAYNGWEGIEPTVPMIQLTTLDEHTDSKTVSTNGGGEE